MRAVTATAVFLLMAGCGGEPWREATVTASAYNATEAQTKRGNVGLTAWGDQLQMDMKALAVSRDLIAEGMTHGAEVRIEGLEGTWIVRDKMHRRWEQKIDIFMGDDEARAREWGVRQVNIRWRPAAP